MYVKSVQIREDYRGLLKGFRLELNTITLLVGDQGCGKSSLLQLFKNNYLDAELSSLVDSVSSYYFDSESMNPRVLDMDDVTNPRGESVGVGIRGLLLSKFQSHGEVLKGFTVAPLRKVKGSLVLLDEPEAGLSIKSQKELITSVNTAGLHNQLVIATHCVPLILSQPEVYDLENKCWVNSQQYVASFEL